MIQSDHPESKKDRIKLYVKICYDVDVQYDDPPVTSFSTKKPHLSICISYIKIVRLIIPR